MTYAAHRLNRLHMSDLIFMDVPTPVLCLHAFNNARTTKSGYGIDYVDFYRLATINF